MNVSSLSRVPLTRYKIYICKKTKSQLEDAMKYEHTLLTETMPLPQDNHTLTDTYPKFNECTTRCTNTRGKWCFPLHNQYNREVKTDTEEKSTTTENIIKSWGIKQDVHLQKHLRSVAHPSSLAWQSKY